jgi:hypothetical protein
MRSFLICSIKSTTRLTPSTPGKVLSLSSLALPLALLWHYHDDFLYLTANYNHTDASYEAGRPVVFVGSQYTPRHVVSWSDRRQYRDNANYCWIDFPNSNLVFAKAPSNGEAVEYDYHAQQPSLALDATPWFPSEYHHAIFHRMVSDDYMIQQSPKSKSYANENRAAAETIIENMKRWNANLVQI